MVSKTYRPVPQAQPAAPHTGQWSHRAHVLALPMLKVMSKDSQCHHASHFYDSCVCVLFKTLLLVLAITIYILYLMPPISSTISVLISCFKPYRLVNIKFAVLLLYKEVAISVITVTSLHLTSLGFVSASL